MKKLFILVVMMTTLSYGQDLTNRNEPIPKKVLKRLDTKEFVLQQNKFSDTQFNFNAEDTRKPQQQAFKSSLEEYNLKIDESIDVYLDFDEEQIIGKGHSYFDENGNQTPSIYYNWDTETQAFVISSKYEQTFNENGNQTLFFRYNWDTETQAFVVYRKEEYIYDENGNQTLSIGYNWDTETQAFVFSNKYEQTFNEYDNPTLFIYYNWDTETQAFVVSSKYEQTFDENDNATLFIYYNWDTETEAFVVSSKYEQTFDEDDNQTLSIGYNWDTETQAFVTESSYEDTFDENGNQTLSIYSNWDTETKALVPRWKIENTFDESLAISRTQSVEFKYYPNIGMYKPSSKTVYSINSDTETKLIMEGIASKYDTNFNVWEAFEGEDYKSYWYYTKIVTLSTEEVSESTFLIYPNPTSEDVKITLSEQLSNPKLELFDISGRKVLSQNFKASDRIDVSKLAPAMYIYKIKDGTVLKKNGKIIKQ